MGLETVTYINDLNASWPVGASDIKGQGDDHIRNIKAAIKATFPNITGAVTLTQAQINALATAGAVTGSGITMATGKLLGRTTAATGAIEEITPDASLSFAAGALGVVAASDTLAGKVELATNAETATGTDTTRAITPAGLASVMPRVLLDDQTLSSGSDQALIVTGKFSALYKKYEFEIIDGEATADNVTVRIQVSTDSGATYKTTDYLYGQPSNAMTDPGGGWDLGFGNNINTPAIKQPLVGSVFFFNPQSAVYTKQVQWNVSFTRTGTGALYNFVGGGSWNSVTALTGFKLIMAVGGTFKGRFRFFGYP